MDQITIKDILECVGENINPAKDIIGSEAEKANTVEYILSKNYFQNLGVIMREYLSTTTLGDLQRKSNDINISEELEEKMAANKEAESAATGSMETTSPATPVSTATQATERPSPFSSLIRSSVGEINQ
jgi:Rrf2 family iron-sulfur cluster assembly transcriptional regulator